MDKILTSICSILDNDPVSPKIQHLQANITSLRSTIADLTDKIGVGYPDFDSHTPPSPAQNKRGNFPSTLTSSRTIIGRASTRKLYLSLDDTIILCRGITEDINGVKLCHNPSCMATKHPTSITGSPLPFHAYFTLPRSFTLSPFPLFLE